MVTTRSPIMKIIILQEERYENEAANFTNEVVYEKIFIEKVKTDKFYSETFIAYYDAKSHI